MYYGIPMHLQPVFAHLGYSEGRPAGGRGVRAHGLAPLSREDVAAVVRAVGGALDDRPVARRARSAA